MLAVIMSSVFYYVFMLAFSAPAELKLRRKGYPASRMGKDSLGLQVKGYPSTQDNLIANKMADKGVAVLGKWFILSELLFSSVTECCYVTYYCQTTRTSCHVKCSPGSSQLFA